MLDIERTSTNDSPTMMGPKDGSLADGAFGPTRVIEPNSNHTHTAIMLHGRGSNGPEFADEIAETAAPGQTPLTERFPGWRWAFLSSQELWSTAFEELLPAWFEAHSLTDTTAREDLQTAGIRESVTYIQTVISEEVARLNGESEKVVIMGISQGGAIGMWALLCQPDLDKRFGAFVGASAWLPFASNIERYLGKRDDSEALDATSGSQASNTFVGDMMSAWSRSPAIKPILSTPVFLGHGVDDAFVGVELGRQARQVLSRMGFQVQWKEYSGAELEGHWLKAPEQIDDIAAFLKKVISAQANTAG